MLDKLLGLVKLKRADLAPLFKGLLISLVGAALTYLSGWITGHDFGVYTPFIVTFWSVIANAVRKATDGK